MRQASCLRAGGSGSTATSALVRPRLFNRPTIASGSIAQPGGPSTMLPSLLRSRLGAMRPILHSSLHLHSRLCSHVQAAAVQELAPASTPSLVSSSAHGNAPPIPWPKAELPKTFEGSTAEPRIYSWWQDCGYFKPNDDAPGEPFTISMPPPNVTGRLHMGHAMFATLQDMMTRTARMRGRKALWLPGTDHAGIATQSVVEKMLAKEGTSRQQLGRDAFVDKVWEWKREYGGFITNQLRRLGASCDWDRERFTLDEGLSGAVAEAFLRLYDKGLIYRGSYMVNWSPVLGTAISDLEVEYTEEAGFMYFFKYPIAGSTAGEYLPVATTRPETILGDTAVAVHPEDERYKQYIGMEVEVPMSGGRRIPIIGDDYVDREFGTGALKITPGHDPNDYEIGKRRGLAMINIMNKDATLNHAAGKYVGMDRFKARKALWKDMEEAGLVIKKDNYTIRAPRSQRSGEIVEPLVSEQWFVRTEPLAKPALEAVADGRITILPDRFAKIYNGWLENIKDWCISRQLWWGHRIPVWYVFDNEQDAIKAEQGAEEGRSERWVVARNTQEALEKAKTQYGQGIALRQENDVLDTWFSSALWPFSTLGWPQQTEDLAKYYPTSVMETGHDILFFWVARMVMMGMEFTGQVPFNLVYLHGLVRDDKGRKMSKSLGNVVDPLEVSGQYGTDALRFTLATGTSVGQDLNLSMDRVMANRNFTNKIWNAGKFILFQLDKAKSTTHSTPEAAAALEARLASADFSSQEVLESLPLAERWIVSRLHQTIDQVTERFDKYDYNAAGVATYNFFWDEFADWFIESSKSRSSGTSEGDLSLAVASYVFERVLRLLHPFMPFVTEELWQALPHTGPALIIASWPASNSATCSQALSQFSTLQGIVRAVRNARAEYNVEVSKKIGATIVVESEAERDALNKELQVVTLLARLEPNATALSSEAPKTEGKAAAANVSLVIKEGVQVIIPMAGLFDVAKELARLNKQRTKLQKDLDGINNKLNNPKFMEKASQEYVVEAKAQQAEAVEKLAMVDAKINQAKALQQA